MSIAGSVPDAGQHVSPEETAKRKRARIFRWRAIAAIAFVLALLVVGWIMFGDRLLARSMREAASSSLGVQVDLVRAHFDPITPSLELQGLAIANPLDSTRNLIEIPRVRVVLDPTPLFVKKISITELTITDVRANTRRAKPARALAKNGFALNAMLAARQFRSQFDVPLLSLTPIDTIKAIALDPAKLKSVKTAQLVITRADSTEKALVASVQGLKLKETADSAEALLLRLKGQSPRTLGLVGTRNAVSDVRRLAARVDSAKKSIEALQASARRGVDSLLAGVHAVDDARKADYEFAKGLMKLPTFDAPNIGPALFGQPSVSIVEKAMYWMVLARQYAPPGLLPREEPGPKRLRRAGTTVVFVTPKSYPQFLLQKGAISLALDSTAGFGSGAYKLDLQNITTEPALVGKPARFALNRLAAAGSGVDSLAVTGVIDHTRSKPVETVDVRAGGVRLPAFPLPSTPAQIALGRGTSSLKFSSTGDNINGRWSVSAPAVTWQVDSAKLAAMSTLARLVTSVVTGIGNVTVDADVGGTIKAPTLSVRSNLDRAVADNIKRVAGEQIAQAETKVRARVDEEAEKAIAPMRAKVAEAQAEAEKRVKEASDRLDKAKADLASQLKSLSAGLLGG